MELKHSDRIFFDETSHSYLLDDERLLEGVTSILKKHNLGGVDYSGIFPEVLNNAAAIGTELHREIQSYLSGESIFATDLIDEVKKLNLKFVEAEYPVSDYDIVASAIDLVCEGSAPDKAILIDIKSTDKYHRRYLEWQLGGYAIMFEAMNPGIKVEALYCLHLDKKKRKIKGFYPVEGVSEEEWNGLLDAERNGLIYIDENAVPDITEALTESEAQALAENASRIADLEATLKALKEADDAVRSKLLAYMEDNNLTEVVCPGGKFTRKKAYTQTRVDSKALESKFPAVYAKVLKTTSVKSSISYKPNK